MSSSSDVGNHLVLTKECWEWTFVRQKVTFTAEIGRNVQIIETASSIM